MNRRSLFIVGAPRSGTSLTRDLLRLSDDIYLPPDEMQIVPPLIRLGERGHTPAQVRRLLDYSSFSKHMRRRGLWPDDAALDRISQLAPLDVVPGLLGAIARMEGAEGFRIWGDKTPEYIFHLPQILAAWPDALILGVVRDPRDAVASMKRAWGRSALRGAVVWRDAARVLAEFERHQSAGRICTIRYEDLTDTPVETISSVCKWLGARFDPARLEGYASEERWGGAAGKAGIGRARPGAYRQHLSEAEIATIEAVCIKEMTALGYSPAYTGPALAPSGLILSAYQLADMSKVLWRYAKERGLVEGIGYKVRQWINWRR